MHFQANCHLQGLKTRIELVFRKSKWPLEKSRGQKAKFANDDLKREVKAKLQAKNKPKREPKPQEHYPDLLTPIRIKRQIKHEHKPAVNKHLKHLHAPHLHQKQKPNPRLHHKQPALRRRPSPPIKVQRHPPDPNLRARPLKACQPEQLKVRGTKVHSGVFWGAWGVGDWFGGGELDWLYYVELVGEGDGVYKEGGGGGWG